MEVIPAPTIQATKLMLFFPKPLFWYFIQEDTEDKVLKAATAAQGQVKNR